MNWKGIVIIGGLVLMLPWSVWGAEPSAAVLLPAKTAASELEEAVEILRETYRKKVAEEILKCDRVEICRFETGGEVPSEPLHTYNWNPFSSQSNADPFSAGNEPELFPVPFYSKSFKIKSKVILEGVEKNEFKSNFRKLLLDPGNIIAACYNPHHGARFYLGDTLVLEADICLECRGFSLHYPGRVPSFLIPLLEESIQPLLLKLLPVPRQ